ncbi:MAG TPA: carboxypeptidase-like regulatory domain-containing protein [Spirochaetota bacterium]|nr:carboxypeptidase-like regulatory domain-containing protein [Spirochaetota bacterium]
MKHTLSFVAVIALFTVIACNRETSVSGHVYDTDNNPLEDVNVLYSGKHERHTSTDATGYYSISESSGDDCFMTNGPQYDISFYKEGYQGDSRNVSVCDDTTVDINLKNNQNMESEDNH